MSDKIMKEIEEKYGEDELLNKDITQVDKVEPVADALKSMGTFWKEITQKLAKDGVCYLCKGTIGKKDKFDIIKIPFNKVDKGLIAFTSICKKCNME